MRGGKAGSHGRDEVPLRGGFVSRQESDPTGKERQRTLALGREESLGRKLSLQPLEPSQDVAEPQRLDRQRTKLEGGAGCIELGSAEDVYPVTVGELESERVEASARHRDREAGAVCRILQGEEDALPTLLAAKLRDLALDPERRQPLEPRGDSPIERRDRIDLAVAVDDGLRLHSRSS